MDKMHDLVWFSHIGKEYEVKDIGDKKVAEFTGRVKTFDWDNCTIQIARSPVKKLRIFIRGHQHKYSDYKKMIVRPTYLLAIDVDSISIPYEDKDYQITSERKDLNSLQFMKYSRYVFRLGNGYWIWEWTKRYTDIKQSNVYAIYERINSFLDNLSTHNVKDDIIVAGLHHDEKDDKDVIPVIYQPAIDKLKNFVREIHCSKKRDDDKHIFIEVSIMFNNEELRRHKTVNPLYEKFRLWFYGRKVDIETFRIYLFNGKFNYNYFTFGSIYSGDYGLVEDTIHGDDISPTPKRNISYYFMDQFHPVVFINTSNHAMAEKDNNCTLWKWEYQPFEEKSPVVFGTKSRKEIDNQFTSMFDRLLRWKKNL